MRPGIARIAWRNLGRNRRRTAIVLAAVTVGMAGVLFSMAINNGLMDQMIENAIAIQLGHLQIHAPGYDRDPSLRHRIAAPERLARSALAGLEGLRAWAPRLRSEGLLISPRASVGVEVIAIDPEREAQVSRIARSIVAGSYLDGTPRRLLIGERLARRLHVRVGSKLVLSVQDASGELTGEAFRVGGIFRTPSAEVDRSTVYLRLAEAQRLYRVDGAVTELVLIAEREKRIGPIAAALRQRLGERAEVRTWEELAPLLVQMKEIFDRTAWYVYAAAFVAMVFGIANVLLMSVFERVREFGILMALGMRPGELVGMVVAESLLITALGLALGYAVAGITVLALHGGIDLSFWAEGLRAAGAGTRIVPRIRAYDVVVPVAVAALTAFVASLWPALRVARLRPAEAVRHG